MSRSLRLLMTVTLVVAGGLSIGVSTTFVGDRPALAVAMLLIGSVVLLMARLAWRRTADPAGERNN